MILKGCESCVHRRDTCGKYIMNDEFERMECGTKGSRFPHWKLYIPNELRAKVFAPYLGCKWKFRFDQRDFSYLDISDLKCIFDPQFKDRGEVILRLKNLANITKDDAIEVSKAGLPTSDWLWCETSGIDLIKVIEDKRCWSFYYKTCDWFSVKQKLIDLQYDVFTPLLNNQTLHEAGLAIHIH